MRFVLNGRAWDLTPESVEMALVGVAAEPLREHGVRVAGVVYPVKQAFEKALGVPRSEFTTDTARRHLASLGLEMLGGRRNSSRTLPPIQSRVADESGHEDPHRWPWEGEVQALFGAHLSRAGWLVTFMADTAIRAQGVDVLARHDQRTLGAEVKGWPSKEYADPRRSGEVKPTQPTTQAGVYFAQALLKAMMLRDTHPRAEALVVLPDFPRYRDVARRTRTGRSAAEVHVVFVQRSGSVESETWLA